MLHFVVYRLITVGDDGEWKPYAICAYVMQGPPRNILQNGWMSFAFICFLHIFWFLFLFFISHSATAAAAILLFWHLACVVSTNQKAVASQQGISYKACCCPAEYYILDAVWAVTWRVVCHAFILWGPVAQWQSIKMTRPSERKKNTSNDGEQELLVRLFDVWSLNIYSAMMERRIKVIKKGIFGWMVTGKIKQPNQTKK